MYKRTKKDSYRKKIEDMIGGQKRSRESFSSSSSSNFNNDTIPIITSDSNLTSSDINDDSSSIDYNAENIHIQKWKPANTKIEGIRKYLETNKIIK